MISKIFQANHRNQWLNTEVASTGCPITKPLESVLRAVALVTRLPTITIGVVSPMIESPTLIDKTTSSVTRPPTLVAMQRL